MLNWGSKNLFGITVGTIVGAIAYGLITGGSIIGVISMGYKGGVGDHLGYGILVAIGMALSMLTIVSVITREGDVEDLARRDQLVGSPVVVPSPPGAYWGPLAAFGAACVALGLAINSAFFYLGVAVLVLAGLEWAIQDWADEATADTFTNRTVRDRVIGPMELPIFATIGIAVIVLGLSRLLLTVSAAGSVVVIVAVAVLLFGGVIAMSKMKDLPRSLVTGAVALLALVVIVGGVVGAANGERDFHHGESHGEHGESHGESGE